MTGVIFHVVFEMSKALRKASKRRPTDAEIEAVFDELHNDNDRGAILLAGAMVEDVLEGAIAFRFGHLTENEIDELFSGTAPLATFSAKIRIAYAMKVINANSRHDLNVIREIRNAFAHSIVLLTLEQIEVANLVNGLHGLKDLPHSDIIDMRSKFIAVVRLLMMVLTAKMHFPPFKIEGIDHLD